MPSCSDFLAPKQESRELRATRTRAMAGPENAPPTSSGAFSARCRSSAGAVLGPSKQDRPHSARVFGQDITNHVSGNSNSVSGRAPTPGSKAPSTKPLRTASASRRERAASDAGVGRVPSTSRAPSAGGEEPPAAPARTSSGAGGAGTLGVAVRALSPGARFAGKGVAMIESAAAAPSGPSLTSAEAVAEAQALGRLAGEVADGSSACCITVQGAAEYVPEIYDQLFREQSTFLPRPNYMETQHDINPKMRSILVDWLVEVHMKYRLRRETLFLTVNLIDRYLTRMPVVRKRLQLVGVVAMLIAAKFEEIDPPNTGNFVYITDNAYTKDEITVLECTMLTTLGFEIVVPTAVHFLDRLQRVNRCDDRHRELAQYLLELALLDLRMIRHAPSHLVASALLLSNELLGRRPAWPAAMVLHARQKEQALRDCKEELRALLNGASSNSLQAVRKKYMLPEHHSVARMNFAVS
mmetsp:Transcript_28484/g.60431  ORF Transcript_28484/g.60431 Transcript_28484/m.60431 type:complete len:468 (+) Transcript_28484:119-1522(+)